MNTERNLMACSSVLDAHVCCWCVWRGSSMRIKIKFLAVWETEKCTVYIIAKYWCFCYWSRCDVHQGVEIKVSQSETGKDK